MPANTLRSASRNPYPVSLLVGPLRASHLYREDNIVYGSTGEGMGTYQYALWAEPPTEMLQDILVRELRASGRYRSVDFLRSNSRGDYVIFGRLYDFKETDGAPVSSRVTLDMQMREVKSGETVWTHYYTHDENAEGKNMGAVVAALDRNAQAGIGEIASSLDQYFAAHSAN